MVMSTLLDRAVDITKSIWSDAFIALYAYGSIVRGEADDWSDIDMCLIRRPCDEHRLAARAWFRTLKDTLGDKIDPTVLPMVALHESAAWHIACTLHCLRDQSWFLLGRDIRARILAPSDHWLRLDNCQAPLRMLRALCEIPCDQPLSRPMRAPRCTLDRSVLNGNIAWAVSGAVVCVLRAIVNIQTGIFSNGRRSLSAELRSLGERDLMALCEEALELRGQVPRFAPLTSMPPAVPHLAWSLSALADRLFDTMTAHGLRDPSYQPLGESIYQDDGTLRADCQALGILGIR